MKLTPHIPLRLQHFEIGRRTLLAICITCLSGLFFCFHEDEPYEKAAIPVKMNIYQADSKAAEKPMSAAFIKNQPAKETTKRTTKRSVKTAKKVYHISSVLAPDALRRRGIPEKDIKSMRLTCEKYVERYVRVAIAEKEKFGIPVCITLAQGLLESDAGCSRLAHDNNNHFGIKCFSKKCKKGHCSNYSDDHHKDFFRIYINVWTSFRNHSEFLQKKRYRKCFDLKATDYKGWARELKKAGYATDPKYADKLIGVIEGLELWQFDQ